MQFPQNIGLALIASCALASCGKSSFETEPVVLQTPQGLITCQLYTPERVMWDHAVAKPGTMLQAEADALCFAEGKRQQLKIRPRARPFPTVEPGPETVPISEPNAEPSAQPGFLRRLIGK